MIAAETAWLGITELSLGAAAPGAGSPILAGSPGSVLFRSAPGMYGVWILLGGATGVSLMVMVSVVGFTTGPVPLSSAVAAGIDPVTAAGAAMLSSPIAAGAVPGFNGADQFLIALTLMLYVTLSPSLSLTEMFH